MQRPTYQNNREISLVLQIILMCWSLYFLNPLKLLTLPYARTKFTKYRVKLGKSLRIFNYKNISRIRNINGKLTMLATINGDYIFSLPVFLYIYRRRQRTQNLKKITYLRVRIFACTFQVSKVKNLIFQMLTNFISTHINMILLKRGSFEYTLVTFRSKRRKLLMSTRGA